MDRRAPMERILRCHWLVPGRSETNIRNNETTSSRKMATEHRINGAKNLWRSRSLTPGFVRCRGDSKAQVSISWLGCLSRHVQGEPPASHVSDWNQGRSKKMLGWPWLSMAKPVERRQGSLGRKMRWRLCKLRLGIIDIIVTSFNNDISDIEDQGGWWRSMLGRNSTIVVPTARHCGEQTTDDSCDEININQYAF